MRSLLLCSTSRYRRELLERLRLPFSCAAPEVDERAQPGEPAPALSERLARSKAMALADRHPDALLIGSDQVACRDGEALGKPLQREVAIAQLLSCSGREVEFHTTVAVYDSRERRIGVERDLTRVRFRALDRAAAERYVALEPALDCAGGFKCEGLGIALFDAIDSRDPTALVGLPLIATARLLRSFGLDPLAG
jgi:septum formation protein